MRKQIGFIGYGLRSATMMQAFENLDADIVVRAICDPRSSEIFKTVQGKDRFIDTIYCNNAEDLISRTDLDGIFIGTRCNLHTTLALAVLKQSIPLFLEKPVCINISQLHELKKAAIDKASLTVVSFPLRLSVICQEVKHIVNSGALGEITQVQAVNNVPYGRVYYDSWYRDPEITGGLFLQKTTHDIDYINFILGRKPLAVYAQTAKMYYKGNKPAGLTCPNCNEYYTCPESSYVVTRLLKEDFQGDKCCFASDTGNEDTASVILTYDKNLLVSYSQNFIAKKSAGRRGARFIGTEAALEFDWYTGKIRIDSYKSAQTIHHQFSISEKGHYGGDDALAGEFIRVMNGHPSRSDLNDGIISAAACLAAKKSAETGSPIQIDEI